MIQLHKLVPCKQMFDFKSVRYYVPNQTKAKSQQEEG